MSRAILLLLFASISQTPDSRVDINATVCAGSYARENTSVSMRVELPASLAGTPVEGLSAVVKLGDAELPAQIESLNGAVARVKWILPKAEPDIRLPFRLIVLRGKSSSHVDEFTFKDEPGDHLEILYAGRSVLRYMYAYDPKRRLETYKPYHHVFDRSGKRLITKGPGGLYPHHRGLFIGWRKVTVGDAKYDLWHMKNCDQRHRKFLARQAGPVFAMCRSLIDWNDTEGRAVISEERQVTVFRQPEGRTLLEFLFKLRATDADVFLDGDKNHGGFQFRAHNEVSTRQQETHYILPRIESKSADIPWAAMSYMLGETRFTVAHMNHPSNPTPTEYSADRKYGRFGAFFKHAIKKGETLTLRYRIMIWEGTVPSAGEIQARYVDFIDPPLVRLGLPNKSH